MDGFADRLLDLLDGLWRAILGLEVEHWILVVLVLLLLQARRIAIRLRHIDEGLIAQRFESVEQHINMVIYELRRVVVAIEDQSRHVAPRPVERPPIAAVGSSRHVEQREPEEVD